LHNKEYRHIAALLYALTLRLVRSLTVLYIFPVEACSFAIDSIRNRINTLFFAHCTFSFYVLFTSRAFLFANYLCCLCYSFDMAQRILNESEIGIEANVLAIRFASR